MARVRTHLGSGRRVRFNASQPDYLFGQVPGAKPEHDSGVIGDVVGAVTGAVGDVVDAAGHAAGAVTDAASSAASSAYGAAGGRPPAPAPAPLVDLSGGGSSKGGLVNLTSPLTDLLDPVKSAIGNVYGLPKSIEENTLGNEKLPEILAAAKQTPEFSTEGPKLYGEAYRHNAPYAVDGPYQTPLAPGEERKFEHWLGAHDVPFDPAAKRVDYDMRGYFKAGGRDATGHFPDTFKTPFDTSFSSESKYATPDNPLDWKGNRLVDTDTGQTVFGPAGSGLQFNDAGRGTTPAVRQALQGVNQARRFWQKTARPDLSGLSPAERAVVPYVLQAHHEYPDIPSSLMMSDIRQESGFNPLAKSPANAQGLSQFIPGTAETYDVQYGNSPAAQQSQVSGQAHYLHDLGFAQDPKAALSGYTGGYSDAAYNNPVLGGARDYAALDKPSRPTPQAVHQYKLAAADSRRLGLKPTSPQAAATPWGGDLEGSGRPDTVFVRADGKGMVNWAESALGTKEGTPRQLNINTKSGIAPSEPWCAAFIAAGLRRRGIEPPSGPAFSGSYRAANWPGATDLGTDLSKAKPGDVVIFGADEHIGLYVGGGQVVAGNWGDEVAKYPASDDSRGISAIVRPPYKGGKVAVHSAAPLPGGSPSSAFGEVGATAGGTAAEVLAASQASRAHPSFALTPLTAPTGAAPVMASAPGVIPGAEPEEEDPLALLLGAPGLSTTSRRPGLMG